MYVLLLMARGCISILIRLCILPVVFCHPLPGSTLPPPETAGGRLEGSTRGGEGQRDGEGGKKEERERETGREGRRERSVYPEAA